MSNRRLVSACLTNLPWVAVFSITPANITTGVAVDAQGNVYVGAGLDNAIYKVRPRR